MPANEPFLHAYLALHCCVIPRLRRLKVSYDFFLFPPVEWLKLSTPDQLTLLRFRSPGSAVNADVYMLKTERPRHIVSGIGMRVVF